MKTKLLLLSLLISSLSFAQYTAIPDANFENALSVYDDIANDGQVPTANINTVTALNVINKNISDLTGIEDFTALTQLDCDNNQLTSLDVSQNTNLFWLHCPYNQLTDLDLSQNVNIVFLWCNNNQLSSLNLGQNTNLGELWCNNNQLSSLDVSQNINLTRLYCYSNQLTGLDVSQNTNLDRLTCSLNPLSSLDLSQNINLTRLSCTVNQLNSLDVSQNPNLSVLACNYNQISTLDVSQNPNLTQFYCHYNQLTSLNVKNGNNSNIMYFNATNNPNLFCIEVDDDAYSTTNWTNIDAQSSFSTDCSAADVDENSLNEAVTMYPNPVNHKLNLSAQDPIEKLSIYNITGQEVINKQVDDTAAQIDMSQLQKGIYFVKVQIQGQVSTFKVVKE